MSDGVDYDPEMIRRTHIDDAVFEAHLTGNDAGELPALAAFAEDLRTMTSGPGPAPSAHLAAMIAEGFSTEHGDLPATAASNVPGPAPQVAGLPKWRKRRMIGEFIAGLSVAARATFGVSMAAASVTAAGAAGALPEPAQNAVSAAVEAVTPFSFPDKASDDADFGGRVSTDARDGGVDGKTVAEDAKSNGNGTGAGDGSRPAEPGTTPAAGHAPTSVPAGRPATAGQPATAGSQSSTGTDTAAETPAAGHLPESVPAGPPSETPPADAGSQSSTGTDTATQTPAAGYVPGSIPAGPPAGRP